MTCNRPMLYHVDTDYLKYIHQHDYRVSVKNQRPFVGVVTMIQSQQYVIPLTSQTTAERKKQGKKKRSGLITTFITETSGIEISNLLYNNMIPVYDGVITQMTIDPNVNTYESNEIRFIRKSWDIIQSKALRVYEERYHEESHNYQFLLKACCDYKRLEQACKTYQSMQ